MATGITIFGTLNGTLGETVYYREGGVQRQRIRVRRPKNPQTNKQLFQRAKFSAAGMFYSHGRQSFFPYAFEDKKKNESNFNVFMRNNASIAYPVSKSVVNNVAYPILHNWVVTKGSLPTLKTYRYSADEGNTQGLAFDVPLYGSTATVNTMADLSKALIETGDYDNGDIITFLTILTDITIDTPAYGLYPEIVPSRSESAHWFIRQFNLNTADTTPLSTYNIGADVLEGNVLRIYVWGHNTSWWPNQLAAGTIVHSRVKGSKTQVSTQALVLSETADLQVNTYLAENYATYVDEIIGNWRTGEQTIILQPTETLQGANSINFNFQPEPEHTEVSITMNPANVTIQLLDHDNVDFVQSPTTEIPISAGDIVEADVHVRYTDALNSWDVKITTQAYNPAYSELNINEIGQRVMEQGWLKYGDNSYFDVANNKINYLQLNLESTTTSEQNVMTYVTRIRVTKPNGTYTDYVVQS